MKAEKQSTRAIESSVKALMISYSLDLGDKNYSIITILRLIVGGKDANCRFFIGSAVKRSVQYLARSWLGLQSEYLHEK